MPQVTTNAKAVFAEIQAKNKILNDSALARTLDVSPSMISAMKAQRIVLGKAMITRILERKLLSARRLKELVES